MDAYWRLLHGIVSVWLSSVCVSPWVLVFHSTSDFLSSSRFYNALCNKSVSLSVYVGDLYQLSLFSLLLLSSVSLFLSVYLWLSVSVSLSLLSPSILSLSLLSQSLSVYLCLCLSFSGCLHKYIWLSRWHMTRQGKTHAGPCMSVFKGFYGFKPQINA